MADYIETVYKAIYVNDPHNEKLAEESTKELSETCNLLAMRKVKKHE